MTRADSRQEYDERIRAGRLPRDTVAMVVCPFCGAKVVIECAEKGMVPYQDEVRAAKIRHGRQHHTELARERVRGSMEGNT